MTGEELRPPVPGTGVRQELDADPAVFDGQWLHKRFFTGSHAYDIRCRTCRAMFRLEGDVWAGEHAQGCPVPAEQVPWEAG